MPIVIRTWQIRRFNQKKEEKSIEKVHPLSKNIKLLLTIDT